ncbi:hypothetical protein [Sphaerisporangium sp. TRM90804]|uniref:hypothetical protein n=1 Tax=Sphaerisporangium sp. TRM90804 TaxID=3031113 RepID=UPI00244D6A6B|nr:hypothetical protein [Sphaerisporangium sp. TRM90804]MDH2428552.1 hypothetical protein [Sphaerisporangium sp. TRM90804]
MLSRTTVSLAVLGVVAAAGTAVYVATRAETGPRPGAFRGEPTSALYAPIASREDDPRPLSQGEVFGPATARLTAETVTMERRGVAASADCAQALWGSGTVDAAAGCSQVVRAGFTSADGRVSGQYAVFDMPDGPAADRLVAALDPKRGDGFLRPAPGQPESFDAARSRADARALGHFVVVNWVGPVDARPAADLTLPQVALEGVAAFAQRRVLDAAVLP